MKLWFIATVVKDSSSVERRRLFLAASSRVEGVGDSLAGVAETLLNGAEDTLALLRGVVAAGAGRVSDLLSSRLLALCEELA